MTKIGYVLSGGGARGFAHLGIIKLLEELGIRPFAIAGTSVGAIVGALYAAGKRPDEIIEMLKSNAYFGWSAITWKKDGFFSMEVLRKILKDNLEGNNFDTLKTKLFVAATDLIKGESVIISKGNLVEAVIASASIPVIFEPVKSADKLLVDGGILNNFPVEPLTNICDVIIGSYVNKIGDGIAKTTRFKTFEILDRCFHLAISNSVYSKVNKCDVFIEVPLNGFNMNDQKMGDKICQIGYNTALQYKQKLREFTKYIAKTGLIQ